VALANIVGRLMSDPAGTAAVAGAVLVRNSRLNVVTKVQEWDYLHGIAAVERLQSLYHGTLVAQGAFFLYRTAVLQEVGGWPDCVGEDIVLTWSILRRGYRVGYAEDAVAFTNVPVTLLGAPDDGSVWTGGECRLRVLRGGSWLDAPEVTAVTIRNPWSPDSRNYANGFRVARSVE
jgi:biofilm PGA synthesis N-glycosyltransferase PgaC